MMEAYLARVGLPSLPPATEQGLRDLHAAQVFAIPFENLTVLLGEQVELSVEALREKLLLRKRGGYCFELNGLFSWALTTAGFSFKTHLARVQAHNPEPGPHTHQLSLAEVSGKTWLCDVGFGGPSLRYPMPFELDRVETQDGENFRLRENPDFGFGLETQNPEGDWMPLYFFSRNLVMPVDIAMGNHFTSTWEKSIFRKYFLLSRPITGGRFTLFGQNFKRREGSVVVSEQITDVRRLQEVLGEYFKIELSVVQNGKLAAVLALCP